MVHFKDLYQMDDNMTRPGYPEEGKYIEMIGVKQRRMIREEQMLLIA